jgi:hypothetical protein
MTSAFMSGCCAVGQLLFLFAIVSPPSLDSSVVVYIKQIPAVLAVNNPLRNPEILFAINAQRKICDVIRRLEYHFCIFAKILCADHGAPVEYI